MLTVEDTDMGIPAEQLPSLFETLFAACSAIGTGIGLFVVKQFFKGYADRIASS